jgi:class 3 adenylate cyclase
LPQLSAAYERHFTVTRYELRGCGLSDDVADYSLEARVEDLTAVADATGADTCVVDTELYGGPVAIAFAARDPARVKRLVLRGTYADGERFYRDTDFGRLAQALTDLTVEQWEFVSRTVMARGAIEGTPPEVIEARAAILREVWTPTKLLAFREANKTINVTALLREVRAPTLVVTTGVGGEQLAFSRELASGIPGARLLTGSRTWRGLDDRTLDEVFRFLGVDPSPDAEAAEKPPTHPMMAVILFLDIADSTATTERIGDAAFRRAAGALDRRMREAIVSAGGSAVEGQVLGDGIMAVFPSAAPAIEAAQRCMLISVESELRMHAGIHAGDVIRDGNNVYGGAVNMAARVCSASAAGQVLVSATVRDLGRTSAGVTFEDRGEHTLKGIEDGVRLFEVRWRD